MRVSLQEASGLCCRVRAIGRHDFDGTASISAAATRKRQRLDLTSEPQQMRGEAMFGLLVGTLNKAKTVDE